MKKYLFNTKSLLGVAILATCTSAYAQSMTIEPGEPETEMPLLRDGIDCVPGELIVQPRAGRERAFQTWVKENGIDAELISKRLGIYLLRSRARTNSVFLRMQLESMSEFNFVEQNAYATFDVVPSDPGYTGQAYLKRIGAEDAWNRGKGNGVVVAVVDSGVRKTHEDLSGRILAGKNVAGSANNTDVTDNVGHGTFVSGIIAMVQNNSKGGSGVAPSARILPVKISEGSSITLTDQLQGVEWAMDNGADIINMSFGGSAFSQAFKNLCADANAQGITLVAAAGNDASSSLHYPAAYREVIAVGATNANADTWANFSNYGSSWVDVSAPGVSILGPVNTAGDIYYNFWNGTSFAAPIVSGLAAIIKGRTPAILPPGLRVKIETNVIDVPSLDVAKGAVRLDRAVDDDLAVKYNDSPESGQLYIGSEAPGTDFANVTTRDNQYWVIRGNANGASAGFDFEDQNSERLGSLALGLDIKANKAATADIQFYNYRTGLWDTVSTNQIGTTEKTIWGVAVDNVGYYHILSNRYINARVISRTASVQLSIDWAKMAVRRIP